MAVATGAAVALTTGIVAGIAAERKGKKTPGGDVLRSAGADISGGAFDPKLPNLTSPLKSEKALPTMSDQAVKNARAERLRDLQKTSGRASTILSGDKFGG